MNAKKRIDQILVDRKLVESRSRAQELINHGLVVIYLNGIENQVKKPSLLVDENAKIEILSNEILKFVSRGAFKLSGAIDYTGLDVRGLKVLDIGLSTGGFSDFLLKSGAEVVFGVDVGQQQTHKDLLNHPRLKIFENTNARYLDENIDFRSMMPAEGFDLVVMDVSFISIGLIFPALEKLMRPGQILLSLVKPQFEVGKEGLGKGGIVKDASLYNDVEIKIKSLCQSAHFTVLDYFSSPIEGRDGNKEFFIYARKN